jgi:hypothetical protein
MTSLYGALGIGLVSGWTLGFYKGTWTWRSAAMLGVMMFAPVLVSAALADRYAAAWAVIAEFLGCLLQKYSRQMWRPTRRN